MLRCTQEGTKSFARKGIEVDVSLGLSKLTSQTLSETFKMKESLAYYKLKHQLYKIAVKDSFRNNIDTYDKKFIGFHEK